MPSHSYKFASVIIGAGPAGLLFAFISRILLRQQNGEAPAWPILFVDKRESYTRTHQLSLDSKVYSLLRSKLSDERFNGLVRFLETWNYRIPVNKLEMFLFDLLANQGVEFKTLELKADNLESIVHHLPDFDPQNGNPWISIVGADSVRSTVRDQYFDNKSVTKGSHRFLARLIIQSEYLPEKLNILDNIKLSKFISSLIAYRYNPNGYAEVDLFLSEKEFNEVIKLGVNPKEKFRFEGSGPVDINAPLFNDFVALILDYTRGEPSAEISLQSTFKLEHSVSNVRVQLQSDRRRVLFLVGDAAIALPFQRGMSALVQAAYDLAETNLRIYQAIHANNETQIGALADSYQLKTEEVLRKELAIVKARSRLIGAVTYLSRISSMLPFPMQSWILSISNSRAGLSWRRFGIVDLVNLFLALSATTALTIPVIIRPVLGGNIFKSVFVVAAFSIQFIGGLFYRVTLSFDRSQHWSKVFWRIQILIWLVLGFGGSLRESLSLGHLHGWSYATLWWVGGVVFGLGMVLGDRIFESGLKD